MSFFAGFLEQWNREDDMKMRREEFNKEMTLRYHQMILPLALEELTKVNQRKAQKAQLRSAGNELGLSHQAMAALESMGKLDDWVMDAQEARKDGKYDEKAASKYNELIGQLVEDNPQFASALDAVLDTWKDGYAGVNEVTTGSLLNAILSTKTPDEALGALEQITQAMGEWSSSVAQTPRLSMDLSEHGAEYNPHSLTVPDRPDRTAVESSIRQTVQDVGKATFDPGGNRVAADPNGELLLQTYMTDRVMGGLSGTNDYHSALQEVQQEFAETRFRLGKDATATETFQAMFPDVTLPTPAAPSEAPGTIPATPPTVNITPEDPATAAATGMADHIEKSVDENGQPWVMETTSGALPGDYDRRQ
jgi:hypothetical protein